MLRTFISWTVFLLSGTFLMSSTSVSAQSIVLQPALSVDTDGSTSLQLLFKPTRTIRLNWSANLDGKGARIVIGREKGNYAFSSIPVSGATHQFIPSSISMTTGRYYARITNSSFTNLTQIQSDPRADKVLSNEIEIIIESSQAPKINAPRGQVTDATPTFSWDAVPGVPAYWIIFSSTPFEITTDANDQIKIQGANVVWQYITTASSARYGDVNPDVTYYDIDAPPLNPGQEYSYAILNIYEESNPVYASPVFGGVVPMRYVNPNAIPRPDLIDPPEMTVFNATETITFRWSEITQAVSYGINLYQVITQQGVDATIPIWSTTTTNTIIDYPALSNLKNAVYQWNVVAYDGEGGGTTSGTSASPTRKFQYRVTNGQFSASAVSALNQNTRMTGVEIYVKAISGGVTPTIPAFLQTGSIEDSLVVGTYEFTAKKDGFADTTFTSRILERQTSYVNFVMRPLPAFVSGTIIDTDRSPVSLARVTATNQLTGLTRTADTDVTGTFRLPLNPGSYQLTAQKPGHISPTPRLITLESGQATLLPDSLRMPGDRATIAGAVLNESGGPIQNARVIARRGTDQFETRTDGTGIFAMVLSSGVWAVQAEKSGFVPSNFRNITLAVGDQLQNQNINLVGRANTISGFVREKIIDADGTSGFSPRPQATVTATPAIGQAVNVQTTSNGQYTLSLGSGSYTISVAFAGYSSIEKPPQMVLGFGETFSGVNFNLQANPSSVAGRVVTPGGTPIGGVTVSVTGIGQTTTNASGGYTLSLPAGNHSVSATLSGYVTPALRPIGLVAGQSLSGIDFVMSANAATISGRITSGGSAISQATIRAVSTQFGTITTVSGQAGDYSMSLQPGTWSINANKTGFVQPSAISVTVSAGQTRGSTDFVLTPNVRAVRGIVTDGINPLRNVEVLLVSGTATVSTITQPNGVYSASLEAGKSYSITARLNGYRTATTTTPVLEPSSETYLNNLTLIVNPASIAGLASDQNLRVLSAVKVLVLQADTRVRVDSVVSNANGQFQLGLAAGSYIVRAELPGYLSDEKQIVLAIGQALTGLSFNLTESFALLSGKITSNSDEPLESVFVTLKSDDGTVRSAQTDLTGSFSISRIIPANYSFTVEKTDFNSPPKQDITFLNGQQRNIDIKLVPNAGMISGVIKDVSGNAVPAAVITATLSDGTIFQTLSDVTGAYEFTSIELGRYTISASKTGYTSLESVEVVLTSETPEVIENAITALVPNNGVIRGNITDLGDNSRLSGVNIQVTGVRGSGSAVSASTGAYSIQNLSAGIYQVIFAVTGWESDTTTVEITSSSPQVNLDRQLAKNAGRLLGSVKNQRGEVLDFRVNLKLESPQASYTTRTDDAGNFIFTDIKTGVIYSLTTEIYRDGWDNASVSVPIARGAGEVALANPLQAQYRGSSIVGTVLLGSSGLKDVVLGLTSGSTTTASQTFLSESDGTFRFRFLAEGTYSVTPQLPGYVFTPAKLDFTLAFNEQKIGTLSAAPNIGNITVSATTTTGPVSAAEVSVVSTDTSVVRMLQTGTNGEAHFISLPAGKNYLVRASKNGFSVNPESREVQGLTTGATVNAAFTFTANSSGISGRVSNSADDSPLPDAILRARLLATNQTFERSSNSSGAFSITGIPAGIYRLTARKTGFSIDTLFNISVGPGEVIENQSLKLELAATRFVGGRVMYAGNPVPGVRISAISNGTFTTETGGDGFFFFNFLPVNPGIADTTIYTFSINTSDFSTSQTIKFTAADIGQQKFISNFNLPSGQIRTVITDGVQPLSGVRVQFVRVGGSNAVTVLTSADGAFSSSNRLRSSSYSLDINRSGYLLPERPLTIALPTDTTIVSQTIKLPYSFSPISEIRADANALISVQFRSNYSPAIDKAELFYRKSSQNSFTSVPLTITGNKLTGAIPAQFSLEDITYYVRVSETGETFGWVSTPATLKPLASGILSRIRMTPDLSDQILRTNDIYEVNFTVFDGVNQDMGTRFTGATPTGQLNVNSIDLRAGVSVERSGMNAVFRPTTAGVYRFKIEARLNGLVVTRDLSLVVTDVPVRDITVARPAARVISTGSYTFTYAALDSSRRRILLGKNKEWFVEPTERGSVSAEGVFTPASRFTIGNFRVGLRDKNTTKIGVSSFVSLFALVQPTAATTLTDGEGMSIQLPVGSLASAAEFSFIRVTPENTKKYIRPKGSDDSYVVSDTSYRVVSTLNDVAPTARITLPFDKSLRHASGSVALGWYNPAGLEWEILPEPTTAKSNPVPFRSTESPPPALPEQLTATGFLHFGQFSVMAQNQSLGIYKAAVLPSPFSPDVAPAKIGYILETISPPAKVDIIIYNMRGEIVRKLLQEDLQYPGRYGSRTGLKEITWDGKTDTGRIALNGRYIIEITARDTRGEQKQRLQIVLVK